MSKNLPLFILLSFFYSPSFSQDFLGLSTGNYSGITGVSLQPASIVDSRFKFDINLFSTGINYSNNYFLLDKNALLKFNTNKFDSYSSFKDEYLSEASLPAGENVFFNISNRTQLPLSFMATTGKKSAIALNMEFRTIIQGRGISQDFAKMAFNDFYHAPLNNTSIDASGINIKSLSWAEVGLTYGRVLFSSGEHFLKGAVTGKYLAGLSSLNLYSGDLQMQINSDSTFDFNSSYVNYNHNKNADFNKLFDKKFSPDANAFGLDAGLVYEYRGNIDQVKYLKSDDEKSYDAGRRDVNKYLLKLGVSLVDVGMFRFDKPGNVNSFRANINNWDIRNAKYDNLNDFDTALANRVLADPNDQRSYNFYMPTALSAQLDVKFVKGLFLNVMSYWPVSLREDEGTRFDKFGYYTITPRFETRHFGIYIPYTVMQRNELTDYQQHLLGATLRLGPLFIGSSNLGSMLFRNNLRAADVHVGLKVGFTYGKPNKSNKVLKSIFKEKDAYTLDTSSLRERKGEREVRTTARKRTYRDSDEINDDNRLLLDYKNGKIFENRGDKSNIIIINNYYGVSPDRMSDTISLPNNYPKYNYNKDSLNAARMEISRLQNKQVTDSISRITRDSLKLKRQQLDSLIESMQQLQRQMDSTQNDVNIPTDSVVSYNRMRMDILQDDPARLNGLQDSLQSRRGEAVLARSNALLQDSAQADLRRQNEKSSADKKKVKPVTDSVAIESNARELQSSLNALSDTLAMQKDLETKRQQELMQLQDSVSRLSQRYTGLTDSLTKAKKSPREIDSSLNALSGTIAKQRDQEAKKQEEIKQMQGAINKLSDRYSELTDSLSNVNLPAQERKNEAVLIPDERNAVAPSRMADRRSAQETKEYQQSQQRQDEMYRQYVRQADGLSKDIDRLNTRLTRERRDDRRNPAFIPVPINNSRKQDPVKVSISNITDTVKITDTVYVRDSSMLRDSIPITDSLNKESADSFVSRPISKEPRIDTVLVRDTISSPAFDFASLPEENILFDLGQSSVKPIYESRLNYMAQLLTKNPGLLVRITGHTDSTGSRAINEKLSLKRAEAVSNFLRKRGVPQKQIVVISEAFENPAVIGNTKSARSQNRRVALNLEKMNN